MKTTVKSLFASILLSGFTMWIVAGIWHNLIMANLYENVHAQHEGIGILLVSYLILAIFMTLLYPRFSVTGSLFEGALWGAIVGLLWVFPHGLAMAGAHGNSVLYVLKNSAWHCVEQGIGGVVIWALHRTKNNASKLRL